MVKEEHVMEVILLEPMNGFMNLDKVFHSIHVFIMKLVLKIQKRGVVKEEVKISPVNH